MSIPLFTAEALLLLTSDTIVEYRILSTPIKVQVLQLNNSNFREVTAASKLRKYNQTVPICCRKIVPLAFASLILPRLCTQTIILRSHLMLQMGKKYARMFLGNNTPQRKQDLSGRQKISLALKTMFKIGIVRFPLPDPSSSSQALS